MGKYRTSERVGDYLEELEKVNPNYGKSGYTKNCQRCVVCYEARMRGYDVVALPKPNRDVLGIGQKTMGMVLCLKAGHLESAAQNLAR